MSDSIITTFFDTQTDEKLENVLFLLIVIVKINEK